MTNKELFELKKRLIYIPGDSQLRDVVRDLIEAVNYLLTKECKCGTDKGK
jgi:hypothetical protein